MAHQIEVTIDDAPGPVLVTVSCHIYTDQLRNYKEYGQTCFHAEARPSIELRVGLGATEEEAIRNCAQAIIDADEVPS